MKLTESKLKSIIREELLSERINYSRYSADIKLPFKVDAKDYHQFESLQRVLNVLIPSANVQYEELGTDGRNYIGIFYAEGEYPNELTDEAVSDMYSPRMNEIIKNL